MNAVVGETLRCLIHNSNDLKTWEILLPTVELVINSLPNSSTGFSPFFLNYGYEPVTPIQLLRGDEIARTESVASFAQRVASDWKLARQNLDRSERLQQKYYDRNTQGCGIQGRRPCTAIHPKFKNERHPKQTSEEVCGSFPGDRDHWGASIQVSLT